MYLIVDAIAVHNAGFGEGSGPIFLDDLMCTGDEASLLECARGSDINASDCAHREDAGVRCQGKPIYIFPIVNSCEFDKMCFHATYLHILYTYIVEKILQSAEIREKNFARKISAQLYNDN